VRTPDAPSRASGILFIRATPICRQAANQSFCEAAKTIRRNSVSSVIIGDKAFLPKCAEVTEHRRKKLWQDDLSTELFHIVLSTN